MAGDRSILPNAARLRRAARAGLRVQTRWLDTALAVFAAGLVVVALPWGKLPPQGPRWAAAIADSSLGPGLIVDAVGVALSVVAMFSGSFIVARVLAAATAGRLGPVESSGLRRLSVVRSRFGTTTMVLLGALALLALATELSGVIAGGARSVDASTSALWIVWTSWPAKAWASVVIVLAVVGVAERVLARHRLMLSLAQSPAEIRAEQRDRGGRR